MDNKERFIGDMVTIMSGDLTSEQLSRMRNCMVGLLARYDLVEHKDLPSTEVVTDEYILKYFLASKKISGCSDKTISQYKYHIVKFLDYVRVKVVEITTNTIRYYLAYLGSNNNSNCYIDNVRRILNSFFQFCENEEYIVKNPCKRIDKIKYHTEIKQPYTDTEVELIRNACQTPREKALVSLLFSTGVRREELTKIKLRDINMSDRAIRIHGKGGKYRTVYFSARCELAIKEYLSSKKIPSEYLFSSEKKIEHDDKLCCEALAKAIKVIGNNAGVENVHLHKFRRWFGTYMANRGVPLQELKEMMGHSNVNVTSTHYTYVDRERIKINYKNNAV